MNTATGIVAPAPLVTTVCSGEAEHRCFRERGRHGGGDGRAELRAARGRGCGERSHHEAASGRVLARRRHHVEHVRPSPSQPFHLVGQRRPGVRREHHHGRPPRQPPSDLTQDGREVVRGLVRHAGERREQDGLLTRRRRRGDAQRTAPAAQVGVGDQPRPPPGVDRLSGEVAGHPDRLLGDAGVGPLPERLAVREVEREQHLRRARRLVRLRLQGARVRGEPPVDVVHRVAGLVVADAGEVLAVLEQPRGGHRRAERQPPAHPQRDAAARARHHEQRTLHGDLASHRRQVERIGQLDIHAIQPELAPVLRVDGEPEHRLGVAVHLRPQSMTVEHRRLGVGHLVEPIGQADGDAHDRQGARFGVLDTDHQVRRLADERARRLEPRVHRHPPPRHGRPPCGAAGDRDHRRGPDAAPTSGPTRWRGGRRAPPRRSRPGGAPACP